MVEYSDLIEAAIRQEIDVLGKQVAIRQAQQVSGLEVDDDGSVRDVHGDGKDVLEKLVDTYTDISGDVAASLIGRKIQSSFPTADLELPDAVAQV